MIKCYNSDTIEVRLIGGRDTDRWVVTFDNYGAPHTFERPGFGEEFFASRGISVISVLGSGNDWYQYTDTMRALEKVREHVGAARRIMTYGSSMGGYAAIRFASRVGANACLALSPQYSNDPRKVPFERRWLQEATTVRWLPELDGRINCSFHPVVVFDPTNDDQHHASLIEADTPIIPISLPYSGHPVGTYLSAARMLEDIVMAVLDDRFDANAVSTALQQQRAHNSVYLSELARRQPKHRQKTGIVLARKALSLAPDSELMLHTLAKKLTASGQLEEALPLHARAVELSNGFLGYALPYSEALALAGRNDPALEIARRMAEENPRYAQLQNWYAHMLWVSGDHMKALERIGDAVRLSPTNPNYAATRDLYRATLNGERWPVARAKLTLASKYLTNYIRSLWYRVKLSSFSRR